MLDWHVRILESGEQPAQPSTHVSAEDAIEVANALLLREGAREVTVYHRLYSNQACLVIATPIPSDEVHQKAAHLERQVQLAARSG
jgi:hypothetical protein